MKNEIKQFISSKNVKVVSILHVDVENKNVIDKVKDVDVSDLLSLLDRKECDQSHVLNYFLTVDYNKQFVSETDMKKLIDIKNREHVEIMFDDVGDYILYV